jgi:hypothetical protein
VLKTTTLFLFLVSSIFSFAQRATIDSLEQNITTLNESVGVSNETIKILEERIAQANDTINNQSTVIGSFEVIYSILTIIFTIIGLLVPIVTYYYGIKPSRDQIKSLEANFDKRLEEYLKTTRHESIDKAIKGLSSNSAEIKQNAITYLSLTQHEGLTDIQYFKLYKVVTSDNIDSTQKHSLGFILTGKENEYATEYCTSILRSKNLYNEYIPARYFGMIGIGKYIQNFVDYLKGVPEKNDAFTRIISHMKIVSIDSVIQLLNSDEIIALFDKDDLTYLKNYRLTNGFEKGYEEDKLKSTKLYKLVFAE